MRTMQSRHLFRIEVEVHPPQDLGAQRRIVPVAGGKFEGARLRGEVLPQAGADWILVRPDGTLQLDVRLTLRTDDGALIFMLYRGVRSAPREVAARLAQGERVDPSEYYFRTAPFFETGNPRYAWINNIVSVGVGERMPNTVLYEVFEVL
jgi:hypothetical protein